MRLGSLWKNLDRGRAIKSFCWGHESAAVAVAHVADRAAAVLHANRRVIDSLANPSPNNSLAHRTIHPLAHRTAVDLLHAHRGRVNRSLANRRSVDRAFADRRSVNRSLAHRRRVDRPFTHRRRVDWAFANRRSIDRTFADRRSVDRAFTNRRRINRPFANRTARPANVNGVVNRTTDGPTSRSTRFTAVIATGVGDAQRGDGEHRSTGDQTKRVGHFIDSRVSCFLGPLRGHVRDLRSLLSLGKRNEPRVRFFRRLWERFRDFRVTHSRGETSLPLLLKGQGVTPIEHRRPKPGNLETNRRNSAAFVPGFERSGFDQGFAIRPLSVSDLEFPIPTSARAASDLRLSPATRRNVIALGLQANTTMVLSPERATEPIDCRALKARQSPSIVVPFQGFRRPQRNPNPRALPWAAPLRSFGAKAVDPNLLELFPELLGLLS